MTNAGRDRMTFGGLLKPHSIELAKMVENFAFIIQSGQHLILNNDAAPRTRPPPASGGGGRNRPKSLGKDHLINIMKSVKHCPLDAPWCMTGSILLALGTGNHNINNGFMLQLLNCMLKWMWIPMLLPRTL